MQLWHGPCRTGSFVTLSVFVHRPHTTACVGLTFFVKIESTVFMIQISWEMDTKYVACNVLSDSWSTQTQTLRRMENVWQQHYIIRHKFSVKREKIKAFLIDFVRTTPFSPCGIRLIHFSISLSSHSSNMSVRFVGIARSHLIYVNCETHIHDSNNWCVKALHCIHQWALSCGTFTRWHNAAWNGIAIIPPVSCSEVMTWLFVRARLRLGGVFFPVCVGFNVCASRAFTTFDENMTN